MFTIAHGWVAGKVDDFFPVPDYKGDLCFDGQSSMRYATSVVKSIFLFVYEKHNLVLLFRLHIVNLKLNDWG